MSFSQLLPRRHRTARTVAPRRVGHGDVGASLRRMALLAEGGPRSRRVEARTVRSVLKVRPGGVEDECAFQVDGFKNDRKYTLKDIERHDVT